MEYTDNFIRLDEVLRITGAKRAAIYKWMRLGTFPKQIPLTSHAVAWRESEVRAWQKVRISERDTKEVSHGHASAA